MKPIVSIRSALADVSNGRFPISKSPPVFGARVKSSSTNIQETGSVWTGSLEISSGTLANDKQLDREEIEAIFRILDSDVKRTGIDALAWYVSFHNLDDEWGIYIPMSSVHYLADRLFSNDLTSENVKFNLAFNILLKHERFHFLADYAQTQIELLLGEPCRYLLGKQFQNGQYLEIEEAIANASMLLGMQKISTRKQIDKIKQFVVSQPSGYRDAIPYFEDLNLFEHGLSEVVKSYVGIVALNKNVCLPIASIDWASHFHATEKINWGDCAVHIIHDDERLQLPALVPKFLKEIPDIRETKKFKKKYSKLARQYQDSWVETKAELAARPPNPKQFEALVGKLRGIYSVRVGSGHRAHLKPINKYEYWEAFEIGTHTEMGHD